MSSFQSMAQKAPSTRTFRIFGGIDVSVKVSSSETGNAFALFECVIPPGTVVPPHSHEREDETFYILEGEFRCQVGREVRRVGPGDVVFVPRGTPHSMEITSAAPGRSLILTTPGSLEQWLADLSEVDRNQSGIVGVLHVSGRHGIELLPHAAA